MLPRLASAAGGAALTAVALWTAGGQLAESGAANWQQPGPRAAAIALAAVAFAWRPRAALLASIVAGSVLVGLA